MVKEKILSEIIDKNGTKIQIVETNCSRCGGGGGSDRWKFTGYTCYKCGGSGRMQEKRKVYTPEYRAKLDKINERRWLKQREKIKAKAEDKNKLKLNEWGFHNDAIYIVIGESFHIKEQLKSEGAIWGGSLLGWYFSKKPSDIDYQTVELEVSKLIWFNDLGEVWKKDDEETHDYIQNKRKENEYQSRYVGKIGEKIELELTVMKSIWLESNNQFYYNSSQCLNLMQDQEGNKFIWKTGKNLSHETDDNNKLTLKGTIKEHREYRDEKQTVLTRCRIK